MRNLSTIGDGLLVEVCNRFIHGKEKPGDIAKWLSTRVEGGATREQVYPLLREAVRRNLLVILPPRSIRVTERIADRFFHGKGSDQIHVVEAGAHSARDLLPDFVANLIVSKILKLGGPNRRVRVGLCGGTMIMWVARSLAAQLSSTESLPKLGFHAITAGYSVHNPCTAPITFLSLFDRVRTDIDYVGLFAPPIVSSEAYDHVVTLPGVQESFKRAAEIDIVVTSLAKAADDHGELRGFLDLAGEPTKKSIKALEGRGWVGDLMYQPYSSQGPLVNVTVQIRPVSIFDLEGLKKMAKKHNKHIIVVAGPCTICHATKTTAVRPLLESPDLKVWTDLVMDLTTAEELLAGPG
jgi:DNA-binding transcriptional regulator LsrR (DeoR family)